MMGLVKVIECPYCAPGRGVIAADLDYIMRAKEEGRELEGMDRSFLIFDPDRASNTPCPHVISFWIDVDVANPAPPWSLDPKDDDDDEDVELTASATYSWEHEWMCTAEHLSFLEHLREVTEVRKHPEFHPSSPFVHRHVSGLSRLPNHANRWWTRTQIVFAMNPDKFVDELRDGMQRIDEQQRRTQA